MDGCYITLTITFRNTASTVCQDGGGGQFLTNSNKAPGERARKEGQTASQSVSQSVTTFHDFCRTYVYWTGLLAVRRYCCLTNKPKTSKEKFVNAV